MGAPVALDRCWRVVLDTNVVLSALLFPSGQLAWLRAAWQAGRLRPLVSAETLMELARVLSYPKFRLGPDDREQLLADFLPWAETVLLPRQLPAVPACRDPFDAPFLNLAAAAKADALVTGDADLLALADDFRVPILTPEALRHALPGDGTQVPLT